jgi:fermentation-respiration switch protein FrsA (DUF1100 family)
MKKRPTYRKFLIGATGVLLAVYAFASIKKVSRLQVPVLYIHVHGTDDILVPHEMSRELYKRTAASKQLKLILGGGHNNSAAVGGEEYLQAVRNFINFANDAI